MSLFALFFKRYASKEDQKKPYVMTKGDKLLAEQMRKALPCEDR